MSRRSALEPVRLARKIAPKYGMVLTRRHYVYRGDRLTDQALRGKPCIAVIRPDGKCIRGRGTMLVMFAGETHPRAVLARQLRKVQ